MTQDNSLRSVQPPPAVTSPAPAVQEAPPAAATPPKTLKTSATTIIAMAAVAVVGVGSILCAWELWPFSSPVVSTDNSYVRGQITVLAPQVNGYVVSVDVKDYQRVKAGQPLVHIDDRIYQQQVDQSQGKLEVAIANLDNVEQTLAQNEAEIGSRQADLLQAQAELERARANLARSQSLVGKGVSTAADLEQITASEKAAVASVMRADAAIKVAQQVKQSTMVSKRVLAAQVKTAQAEKDLSVINRNNTVVVAPRDGQIGEASVRPGQYVSSGSQLMSLVPEGTWVVANFKETQTSNMRPGQPATISVDALGGGELHGVVDEISPATGSEFSVLRADNASGNFTKVVQRLTVRIKLNPGDALLERIRPGMSVRTNVDTSPSFAR